MDSVDLSGRFWGAIDDHHIRDRASYFRSQADRTYLGAFWDCPTLLLHSGAGTSRPFALPTPELIFDDVGHDHDALGLAQKLGWNARFRV